MAFHKPRPRFHRTRVNHRIRVPQVMVIDEEGKQLGVMPTREAMKLAAERELDLVEIVPHNKPPICRILDFGKYQYDKSKSERKARRRSATNVLKEMRYRPKIDDHDIEFKTKKVRTFLEDGHKVRLYVLFRGRELTHTEFGRKLLERVMELLEDLGQPETPIRMEGRNMSVIFSPKKGAGKAKPKSSDEKKSPKDAGSAGSDSLDAKPDREPEAVVPIATVEEEQATSGGAQA